MAPEPRIFYLKANYRHSDIPIPIGVVDHPPPNLAAIGRYIEFRRGSRRWILIPLDTLSPNNEAELWKLGKRYYDAIMGDSRLAFLTAPFTAVTIDLVMLDQVCT